MAKKLYDRHHALPNPLSLQAELLSIGPCVQVLCNFTIGMAEPTWKEPGNAAAGAAVWTYAGQIAALYTTLLAVQDPNGEDLPGAVSEEEFQRIQAS